MGRAGSRQIEKSLGESYRPPERVLLLNKSDRLKDNREVLVWQKKVPGAIPICALLSRTGQPLGHAELIERVRASSISQLQEVSIRLPLSEGRAIHAIETRATACTPGIEAWPEREDVDALAALEPDVLAALDWCFGDGADPATGRALEFAIGPLWFFRSQVGDLVHWAVTAPDSLTASAPLADHHRCAYYLAVARWSAGDLAAATAKT